MTENFYKALKFAIVAHNGQYDLGCNPYILHPLHVAMQMDTEDEQIVALLHDIVEDTKYTFDDITNLGFGHLVDAIDCLTKRDSERTYAEYINRVCSNKIAIKVKIEDMKHNSDESRLPSTNNKFKFLLKRYKKYAPILEESLREIMMRD